MEKIANQIKFYIGKKQYSFLLEENEQTAQKIINLIEEISNHIHKDKESLTENDYAYIILILATNLIRKEKNEDGNLNLSGATNFEANGIEEKVKKLIEKLTTIS